MKVLITMLLLSIMSVSCGNKNSSGSKGSDSEWDMLEDDNFTNTSYQQEQKISRSYLCALKSEFKRKRSKIRKTVGLQNFRTIEPRLAFLQIKTERRVMEELRSRNVVSSYYDGYVMNIYIGAEEKSHSWRYLLKDRTSRTENLLYQDLLKLRGGSSFEFNQYNFESYNRGNKLRGGYHLEFRIR